MLGKTKTSLLPAYGLITALLTLIIISHSAYSQEYSALDSLKIGSTYKIILFDDTEIIGKIIQNDSEFVTVNAGLANRKIKKDDIFNISRNLIPSKYRFMFSAGGGIIFPGGEFPYGNNRHYNPSISFQLNSAFVVSPSKAFRIDVGYSRIKKKSSEPGYSYSGGDANLISFRCDFIIGVLKPESFYTAYAIVGLGLHYTFVPAYSVTSTWRNSDTSYITHTYNIEQEQKMNFVLAIGGGAGIKLNKNLLIYTEVQYNSVTYNSEFFFFPFASGYIPMRIGISYRMF